MSANAKFLPGSLQVRTSWFRTPHPSPYEPTAEPRTEISKQEPTNLVSFLTILIVVLGGSNAALAYEVATQRSDGPQFPLRNAAEAHNFQARLLEYIERDTSVRLDLKSSEQLRPTEISADQVCLEEYSLSPSEKDQSWEASCQSSNNPKGFLGSFKNDLKYSALSFYVQIDPLTPNYQAQPLRNEVHQFWVPPNIRTGYTQGTSILLHWMGGTMNRIAVNDAVCGSLHQIYSSATVFTQNPDTPHLLVVPFDAPRIHIYQNPRRWRPLAFHHVRIDNTQRTYSAVSTVGDRHHIAAPGSPHWMPQLIPSVYDYQDRSPKIQAGLIGNIPLLIALAAFSAPQNALVAVLTNCLRPHCWRPHQFRYPSGRERSSSFGRSRSITD